jgi:peptidoglycan/xylan/chitin deacetylase (PgdA/CDA1 family)
MSGRDTAYLMFHEIEVPGRPVNQTPGYLRYVVTSDQFSIQLKCLVESNVRGVNVSQALSGKAAQDNSVVITFDDGCETDLLVAAPLLQEFGFFATSYVVVDYLDREGYLSTAQLRELNQTGQVEIGSHSMSHKYLRHLSNAELLREIVESKDRLEQILGIKVRHFSCPGGRWDARVQTIAKDAGYESVATSEVGLNNASSNPYRLKRLAIYRTTSAESFSMFINGKGLTSLKIRNAVLDGAKNLLGDKGYDRVRSLVLTR